MRPVLLSKGRTCPDFSGGCVGVVAGEGFGM